MLFKCSTQYFSNFWKLSNGHRTGKGQFSFQTQRRALPKNVWASLVAQTVRNPPALIKKNKIKKKKKESTCSAGNLGLIPGLGIPPGGGHGNLFWCSCVENPHEQRSLVGYSPWGCKESDMAEWLSTAQQRMFKLLYSCICFTCLQDYTQNSSS